MTADTLVQLVARSVAEHPRRDAIVTADRRWTYLDLWAAVRVAARELQRLGVQPGDRVVLLARLQPESVGIYYAILAAGGVVVPLDRDATPYELAARIAHSEARLVVADGPAIPNESLVTMLPAGVTCVRACDVLGRGLAMEAPAAPASRDANAIAAILYTSGTTGDPKGVMLTHRNLVSNVLAVVESLELTWRDKVLSPLPLYYAYGNSVLHTHLAAGAAVVFADMAFPQHTVDQMIGEGATGLSAVPWMFATLLGRTTFRRGSCELSSLRYMTQAGGPMPPSIAAKVADAFPGIAFHAMYGQTEATSRLTCLAPVDRLMRPGSVGSPIRGVRLEIRRADGSKAAPGETGEVVATGSSIMAGYWRAPDATRGVLVTDDRGTWLRTGDLGYLDADGYLYLQGRLDEMIKVAGHRVNPEEVEEVVLRLPGVAEAAAVGVPDDLFGAVVHLLVVPASGRTVTCAEVLAHCRRHLSAHKCPHGIRFVGALPRTASGKVRRVGALQLVGAAP
jgi:acyl-CoA synthetase (AMP-forming)/AMP-acid ligase II